MIYVTGDTHGNFGRIRDFCIYNNTTKEDLLIILGDAGINYCQDISDRILKEAIEKMPIRLFCIHGNHEQRPYAISSYTEVDMFGGKVYVEPEYPSIIFAKDGEVYNFDGLDTLVCGGAYSVDKFYRLARGAKWFDNEQPSDDIKNSVRKRVKDVGRVDVVLTHTCPSKYIPTEMFLAGIDQSSVDASTEEFLQEIESALKYSRWLCGHYHTDKTVDKIEFLYKTIKPFGIGE